MGDLTDHGRSTVLRCDASVSIGGGHVMRCLALADGLAVAGWRCTFAVRCGTAESVSALPTGGHAIVRLEGDEADESAEIALRIPSADLLIVDHYGRDAAFERRCRSWADRIVVIDDLADRPHDADILLDQTVGRCAADYASFVSPDCRFLLGPGYGLLRPEFARLRAESLARRDGRLSRILICMGNADPHDVTSLALRGAQISRFDGKIDVVLGSHSPNRRSVAAQVDALGVRARLHIDSVRVGELMTKADLAVGSSGVIALERCALGLPAVVVMTADNQRLVASRLASASAVIVAGDWKSVNETTIADAIEAFMRSPGRLSYCGRAAAAVCDGQGIGRVVAAIEAGLVR